MHPVNRLSAPRLAACLGSLLLFSFATATSLQADPGLSPSLATQETAVAAGVLFFDDFDGDQLRRENWNVIVTGKHTHNNEQQAYVDSDSVLYLEKDEANGANNGALVIQARFTEGQYVAEQNRTFNFISGRITTKGKAEFTYGKVAARMKLPAGSGLWPAFWMLGNESWPGCGEIDIMECIGEADWTGVALHGPGYSGETPLVNKFYFPDKQNAAQWHVYSIDWSPDEIVFRIDDRIIYRVTKVMVERFGEWRFSNKKYLILNLAIGGAYPVKSNGIKQPYFGLPMQTVERIKSGEAKVLVDWVRVTEPVRK